MQLTGTQKKWLAILGGIAVAIAGALTQAFPNSQGVHLGCELALIVLGALGFTFPVSIKKPDEPATPPTPTYPVPPPLPPAQDANAPQDYIVDAAGPTIRSKQAGRVDAGVLTWIAIAAGLTGMALAGAGCSSTLGKCELNALPQSAETLIADVLGIVANPASVVADLEALPDQPAVACVVAAVKAWMDQPHTGARMLMAGDGVRGEHAHLVLDGYLSAHKPTACTGRATAAVERVLQ